MYIHTNTAGFEVITLQLHILTNFDVYIHTCIFISRQTYICIYTQTEEASNKSLFSSIYIQIFMSIYIHTYLYTHMYIHTNAGGVKQVALQSLRLRLEAQRCRSRAAPYTPPTPAPQPHACPTGGPHSARPEYSGVPTRGGRGEGVVAAGGGVHCGGG